MPGAAAHPEVALAAPVAGLLPRLVLAATSGEMLVGCHFASPLDLDEDADATRMKIIDNMEIEAT